MVTYHPFLEMGVTYSPLLDTIIRIKITLQFDAFLYIILILTHIDNCLTFVVSSVKNERSIFFEIPLSPFIIDTLKTLTLLSSSNKCNIKVSIFLFNFYGTLEIVIFSFVRF